MQAEMVVDGGNNLLRSVRIELKTKDSLYDGPYEYGTVPVSP